MLLVPALVFVITYFVTFLVLWSRASKKNRRLLEDASLSTKIIIGFLIVSLTPIGIISLITSNRSEQIIVKEKIAALETTAALKAQRIESFFEELSADIVTAQAYSIVKSFLDSGEGGDVLDEQLKSLRIAENFLEVILIGREGKIAYTTGNAYKESEIGKKLIVGKVMVELDYDKEKVLFSDIFTSEYAPSGYEMFVTAPVVNTDNELLGHIVVAAGMGPVYGLTQDYTGLGETGETILGKKVEPHAGQSIGGHSSTANAPHTFFLNPTRHDPGVALNRVVTEGSGDPLFLAASGEQGSGVKTDYRGEEVVAAWQYLPGPGWGMVAKVDTYEAFAPVRDLQIILNVMTVVLVILVFLLAHVISGSISWPIKRLTEVTERVGFGDTKLMSEIELISSKDEIGKLARTFLKMFAGITESRRALIRKLEELERFQELTVDRELKMADLKKQVKNLESKLNSPSAKTKKKK